MQSLAQRLGALGRYGDDSLAHVDTGEMVLPRSVLNPSLFHQIMLAMDRGGLDPNRYVVGSGAGSYHPHTGMQEFFAGDPAGGAPGDIGADDFGGGDDGGGYSAAEDMFGGISSPTGASPSPGGHAGDPGQHDEEAGQIAAAAADNNRSGTVSVLNSYPGDRGYGWEGFLNYSVAPSRSTGSFSALGPVGSLLGTVGLAAKIGEAALTGTFPGLGLDALASKVGVSVPDTSLSLGGGLGYGPGMTGAPAPGTDPLGGQDPTAGGMDDFWVEPAPAVAPSPQPPPIPQVGAPGFITFPAGMTDLQRRAWIANQGVSGDDSRFRAPETQRYLQSLTLNSARRDDDILPVEAQYYRDVAGLMADDGMRGIYDLIRGLSL